MNSSFGASAGGVAPEDTFIDESELPSLFDELDPMEESDFRLRTLVDFEVLDAQGNMVSFHELQKCKENGIALTVRGYVVEPLDLNFRQAITNSAASAESTTVAAPEESLGHGLTEVEQPSGEAPELDRNALTVGTSVDGYCNKTFQWFAAKIVAIRGGNEIKVHFQGWNAKHDEWIDRQSDRLAPYGSSAKIVFESIRRAEDMVPWYEQRHLYAKAQRRVGNRSKTPHPYPQGKLDPKLKRQAVVITGVSDWCIDLSYCSPSLWLVADSDVWYRVAGSFVPGGVIGFPSEGYASIFDPFVCQFEVCAHVAMVLCDFYGQNPKLTMLDVAAEVIARTKQRIGENLLLDAWALTSNQISNMPRSADWDLKSCKPFKDSTFVLQLIRYGKAASAARDKLMQASLQATEPKPKRSRTGKNDAVFASPAETDIVWKWLQVGRRQDQKQTLLNVLLKSKEKEKGASKAGRSGSSYPLQDSDVWDIEFFKGKAFAVHPKPIKSPRVKCPSLLMSHMLQTWGLLMQFRSTDALGNFPYINLDSFISLMGLDTLVDSVPNNQLPMLDPLLRNLFIRLLAHGFSKGVWDSLFCNTRMSLFEALPIVFGASYYFGKHELLVGSAYTHCFNGVPVTVETYLQRISKQGGFFLQKSSKYSAKQTAVQANMLSPDGKACFFRDSIRIIGQGDAWVEVLRMALAQQEHFTLPEYADPIADTLYALLDIANDPQAEPFLDASTQTEADYKEIVPNPIDLNKLIQRIEQGWYDHFVCTGTNPKSAAIPGNETRFRGRAGILHDVQRVWDNCRTYWKTIPLPEGVEVHPLVCAANELEVKFSVALTNRKAKNMKNVHKPAASTEESIKSEPSESNSEHEQSNLNSRKFYGVSTSLKDGKFLQSMTKEPWEEVAAALGKAAQPAFIPRIVLLHSLRWLLLEFSRSLEAEECTMHLRVDATPNADTQLKPKSSGPANSVPKSKKTGAAAKGKAKKGEDEADRADREANEREAEDIAAATAASLADIASKKADEMDVEGDEGEEQVVTAAATSKAAKERAAALEAKYNACVIADRDGKLVKYQNEALGFDRHGHRYWTFSFAGWPLNSKASAASASASADKSDAAPVPSPELGMDAHRIYCEDVTTGKWYIYSHLSDLQALLAWLDTRGKGERALFAALYQWMVDCGLPVTAEKNSLGMDPVGALIKSEDEGNDGPSSKRARPTPTSSEATDVISANSQLPLSEQYKQKWHPFELTSLLYSCRVKYVDSLGMGVKETKEKTKGRNIVVVNHSVANSASSAAAEAGICLGDRLITCNGQILNNVKSIQSAIAAAKEKCSEGQGVILDIVVARSSNQLGRIDKDKCDDNVKNAAKLCTMDNCDLRQTTDVPQRTAGQLVDMIHRYFSIACTPEGTEFVKKHIPALTALVVPLDNTEAPRPSNHPWQYSAGIWDRGAPPLLQLRDTLLMFETFVAATFHSGSEDRGLLPLWLGDDRLRFRWRRLVAGAHSYSTISMCAVVLSLALNRPQL